MGSSCKECDLEAGITPPKVTNGTRKPNTPAPPEWEAPSSSDYSSDGGKTEQQVLSKPSVHFYHPITTQREHFLASIGESVSIGLGLGSAVSIWTCVHDTLKMVTHGNVGIANWEVSLTIGFPLAPFFEKAARVVVGKTGIVLAKPHCPNTAMRFVDHSTTITSALVGVGLCMGIQMQYGPLHSSLGFEYGVFVVDFTAHAFLRIILYTLAMNHEYEAKRVTCGWARLPSMVFWEYSTISTTSMLS